MVLFMYILSICTVAFSYFCTNTLISTENSSLRIVALGDVHGHYSTMMTDLFLANITVSDSTCEWKSQEGIFPLYLGYK